LWRNETSDRLPYAGLTCEPDEPAETLALHVIPVASAVTVVEEQDGGRLSVAAYELLFTALLANEA